MEASEVEALIQKWQERLRLRDWDIRFSEEAPDDGCAANSDAWGQKRIAVIRIDKDFGPEATERSVVHELLHVVLRYIRLTWSVAAEDYIPPATFREVEIDAKDEEEIAIEQLTVALTGLLYDGSGAGGIYERTFGVARRGSSVPVAGEIIIMKHPAWLHEVSQT